MTSREVVLVTGGTGFLGRHVCRSLFDAGKHVRVLVRPGSAPVPSGAEPVFITDLLDHAGVAAALRGVDSVIHLAARVHVMRESAASPIEEFRRVNVKGTRVLLEEAANAGVTRFLFASSVKAMGEESNEPWTEQTPPGPVDPYGVSKLEAELLVRESATRTGLHAPILRLPLMYGAGMKANMLRLFRSVDLGVPLPLARVVNLRSMLYTGNAVAAMHAVLASPAAGSETFLVSDGHDLSTPGLIGEIARALGRPARLVPIPMSVFRAIGRVGDLLEKSGSAPLTSAHVHRLMGSLQVDPSKITRVTGFVPPFSVQAAMDETARWYLSLRRRRAAS